MRRWWLLGIAIVTVMAIAFLGQTAIDPQDYTGQWYSASGQQVYCFQEGVIYCDKYAVTLSDGTSISGAYSFSGKKVALFALGVEGLESVKELYLVENKEESLLCERKDGSGQIYFVRHK